MTVPPPLDLGLPPPIPPAAHAPVQALLASGRLHRYAEVPHGETAAARLESAFADLIGTRYAVAVNSCGSALYLALLGSGVRPGEPVLMSAFTLAPVLGAIANAGAIPVAVEITDDLVLDLEDLAGKARSSGARHLLLSHMRGHICDLGALSALCDQLGITLIEDCAHTLGATWAERPTGAFGRAGCFSFQAAKHINAGEGGMIVTADPDLAARAILHSGSYMLYRQNGRCPDAATMGRWRDRCPNFSLRLSELAAELAFSQLPDLPARAADWNTTHDDLARRLAALPGTRLPRRSPEEGYVQSSLQFALPGFPPEHMASFVARCRADGLYLKWFGTPEAEGYTSAPRHWSELAGRPTAPRTQAILDTLCDLRLPLGLAEPERARIADTIAAALTASEAAG